MKVMISQPMAGIRTEEILEKRRKVTAALTEKGYDVADTLFKDSWYRPNRMRQRGVKHIPLYCLGKALEEMSRCDAAYFCAGWAWARGCRIEHDAAAFYGLQILYEEPERTRQEAKMEKRGRKESRP